MGSVRSLRRNDVKIYLVSDDSGERVQIANHSQTLAIEDLIGRTRYENAGTPFELKGNNYHYMAWVSDPLFPVYFICSKQAYVSIPKWREVFILNGPAVETIKNLNIKNYKPIY